MDAHTNIKHKTLLPYYIKGLAHKKFTLKQASESTGYTIQWLMQLRNNYIQNGFIDLENKNKNRIPKNKKPEKLKQKIVAIYVNEYKDVNFKFFCKCLKDYEGINICYTTLRNVMSEYGIKSPEARKVKTKIKAHRPRLRRQNEGDLLQIDGTPFEWFYKSGDNKKYCMHGAIDDATGKITGLYITENECLYGYLEMLRQTITNHGIPREIYSDRAAIFCVTPKNKKNLTIWEELAGIHDKRTQWQRILADDLHVKQILAWSPQAKGRVERMWQTLQGRIPMIFYKNKIKTVEAANRFLPKVIEDFNKEFSIEADNPISFYRSLDHDKNLDDILCAKIDRKTNINGTFMFHSYRWCVMADGVSNKDITLCISERGITAKYKNEYHPVQLLDDIQNCVDDSMPEVLQNIVYRYMYAYAKEISA